MNFEGLIDLVGAQPVDPFGERKPGPIERRLNEDRVGVHTARIDPASLCKHFYRPVDVALTKVAIGLVPALKTKNDRPLIEHDLEVFRAGSPFEIDPGTGQKLNIGIILPAHLARFG
jgi:hypothetical protein